jgi:hypothetical protein
MTQAAEVWKTEFHVISDDDGEAFAWEPSLADAIKHTEGNKVRRIERVTYYYEDRETVWPFDVSERTFDT